MKPDTYLRQLRTASKRELLATVMELARLHYDSEVRETVAVSRPGQAHQQVRDIARSDRSSLSDSTWILKTR